MNKYSSNPQRGYAILDIGKIKKIDSNKPTTKIVNNHYKIVEKR